MGNGRGAWDVQLVFCWPQSQSCHGQSVLSTWVCWETPGPVKCIVKCHHVPGSVFPGKINWEWETCSKHRFHCVQHRFTYNRREKLGLVGAGCYFSNSEGEARGSQAQGQAGLQSELRVNLENLITPCVGWKSEENWDYDFVIECLPIPDALDFIPSTTKPIQNNSQYNQTTKQPK